MSVNVNTNVSAMTAQRHLGLATDDLGVSMERLASGNRINSSKDDAAGLQISNRLISQSRGIDVALRNANDGISIAQTAEGGMTEATSVLQRIRDLGIQSANGTNSISERRALHAEVVALQNELQRIAQTTSFGGRRLLNGSFGDSAFQVGANAGEAVKVKLYSIESDNETMGGRMFLAGNKTPPNWAVAPGGERFDVSFTTPEGGRRSIDIETKEGDNIEEVATYINGQANGNIAASVNEFGQLQIFAPSHVVEVGSLKMSGSLVGSLNIPGGNGDIITVQDLDVRTVGGSQMAISVADSAVRYIDAQRAELGAQQNRLGHTINNLSNIQENVEASKSRIRDADYAKESVALAKAQILQQAGTTILAQAKQLPNAALSLLQ